MLIAFSWFVLGGAGTHSNDQMYVIVGSLVLYAVLFLSMLLALLLKASMMQVVAESYVGHSPSGCSCIKKACSRLSTLFCYVLIFGLAVMIVFYFIMFLASSDGNSTLWKVLAIAGSVVCGAWLAYFLVSIVCAVPAIMIENQLSAIDGITRSRSLIKGHYCYVFGIMFLLIAASNAIALIPGCIGSMIGLILVPFSTILPAIIYLNLRVTKEGLTREELLRELGLPEQLELEEPTEIAVAIAETKPALDQENKIVYTLV